MSLDPSGKGSFLSFQKVCQKVANEPGRLKKTSILNEWLSDYTGNKLIFLELILPKHTKRVYNLANSKLWKLFGTIFNQDSKVFENLYITGNYAGDVSGVVSKVYSMSDDSDQFPLQKKKSALSMKQVNDFLVSLTKETKHDKQCDLLNEITSKCNVEDLKWFIRLIDKDLRIDAGAKCVLDALHKDAYDLWQTQANFQFIVNKVALGKANLTVVASILSPLKPMLASACKSYGAAFKKCSSGLIYAEIKYDGERVQIHWDGKEWKFYARSLKPVVPSKVAHVKDALPEAMKDAKDLILDSEILMVDSKTGDPLPFGSLGKHKRNEFSNAMPCLFVFDILHLNGESLIKKPLKERRKVLETNLKEIKNKIHLSKLYLVKEEKRLQELMEEMIEGNKEGLVLKDSQSVYEPNKRHWLKMKKDYLAAPSGSNGSGSKSKTKSKDGSDSEEDNGWDGVSTMADSADLVVLGAYQGSGRHGGMYSTFLCGVLDKDKNVFETVCKVHNGLDDEQIETYTKTLNMDKFDKENMPRWMNVLKEMYPDWVVRNPKKSPVFEVTGFEFTNSKRHTATDNEGNGISIRFPRVTRIRSDKNYKSATNLQELRHLVNESRNNPANVLKKGKGGKGANNSQTKTKTKAKVANNNNNNNNNSSSSSDNKKDIDEMGEVEDNDIEMASSNNNNNNSNSSSSSSDSSSKNKNNNNNNNNNNKRGLGDMLESDDDDEDDYDEPPLKKQKLNNGTSADTSGKNDKSDKSDESDASLREPPELTYQVVTPNDGRKTCKYGVGCYRKNKLHFGEFTHVTKEDREMKEVTDEFQGYLTKCYEQGKKNIDDALEKRNSSTADAKKSYENAVQEAKKIYDDVVKKADDEYEKSVLEWKEKTHNNYDKLEKTHATKVKEIEDKYKGN